MTMSRSLLSKLFKNHASYYAYTSMSTTLETQNPEPATPTPAPLNLIRVLQQMLAVSDKVSDLIFSPGRPPQVELVSKLQPVPIPGIEKLTPAQTLAIA